MGEIISSIEDAQFKTLPNPYIYYDSQVQNMPSLSVLLLCG